MVLADLHVHSCLSPCAELTCTPRRIARKAKELGLAIVGLCDHNSVENLPAMLVSGDREGIGIVCGMEITTAEEVHVLGLFQTLRQITPVARIIRESLPKCRRQVDLREQVIVDEDDYVSGFMEANLAAACALNCEEVVKLIHENNGYAIAAHVDRPAFGLLGQLGFMPEGLELDAVECSRAMLHGRYLEKAGKAGLPVLFSSDAHSLEELGLAAMGFDVESSELPILMMALKQGKCSPIPGEVLRDG